jgi:hypothetical protein
MDLVENFEFPDENNISACNDQTITKQLLLMLLKIESERECESNEVLIEKNALPLLSTTIWDELVYTSHMRVILNK